MRISKRGNRINSAVKRISDNKGVTLSILVVTIIILIILAGITLSAVIGNNGLVKTSEIIEERQIISELTQDLKLKASQARTNRISTDETSLKDIFLNNLKEQGIIEDKDVNPEKDTYITVDDKYVYLVEEKNDDLYIDYRGKVGALFPKIIDISLTNTTNSIATTVTAIDADKFNFYIKDSEDGEYRLLDENNEEGKYTYGGLRQDKTYYLKFVAINENGEDVLEVTRITGVLPTGTITIGDFDWSHETERATFIITTKAQGFILQYTTTPSDIDSWKDITSGTRTEGIEVGKTVYARLWDRVNEADEEYASATVQPQEGSVVLEATSGMTTYPDTLTINILENLSRGRLRVESSNENIATGVAIVSGNKRTGTLIIKPGTTAGTTTLRVISEETKSYKEAEAIFEITVEKGTLNVTSTGYTGIYDGEAHAIDVRCAQEGAIITYSQTENGTYSEEKPTYTNAGTYTTYYKVDLAGYYTYEGHEAVTIGKQKVLSPTNLQVTTEGKVYWDESSNATGYEISIDNSNWQTATSGIDYLNKITEQKGTRTVYVRAINSDSSNYVISDNAVKDVTVLTLSITKNSEVRGTVDCASYNVISGVTYETNNNVLTVKAGNITLKEVTATANVGYSFNKWSIASGTITQDTTVTAEFDIDTYTIEYTLNEGRVIGQNPTSYTVETNEITLINPIRNGYTFIGWSGTELTGNENKSVKIAKGSVGDRAYEAHWIEKTYTLSINPNGGKIDDSTTTVTRNLKYSDVSYVNNPTREGHTFAGWNELSDAQYSNGLSSISVYNNARNGVVTITTQAKSADNPITGMANEVKLANSGAAQTTPGLGGFLHGKTVSANKKYVHVIVAKLPSGYYFHNANNQLGAGATTQWLTSNEGTGKWQTYIYQVNSGSSGTFSNFGFVYVSKDKDNTWSVRSPETGAYTAYIAYSNIYDITNDDTGIGQIDGTGVLTANWTANTYTVVYNGNGNTGGSTASSMHTYDVSKNLTANGFTKAYTITYNYNGATGGNSNETSTSTYTFAGWATSASGNKVYDDQASVKNLATSGTFDLYAKWSGGAVTLPTPTKTGYTFGGWFTNSGLTASAGAAGASYTATQNITLYAKWTVNSYSLVKLSGDNLITNGKLDNYTIVDAPTNKANGVTHTWDKELNGIPGNTDKAYNISGWGTGANMGVAVPEIGYHAHMKIVNNNNVLDYKTNEAYNGKTQADVPGGSLVNGTVTTGRWLGISQEIIASKLTAGKTYAITMDVYRVSGTTYVSTGLYHKATSKEGTNFHSGIGNLIPTTTGKWETLTYVFTLSPDYLNTSNPSLFIYGNYGGSGELYVDNVRLEEVTPINKNYDVAYTSSEVAELTKTGYTFGGWYNNSSFTTRLSTSNKFTTSTATFKDVQTAGTTATIFAKWTVNSYTIVFNGNGHESGSMSNLQMTYDNAKNLTANAYTKPGYTFDSWNTKADGTGTRYTNNQSVNNLTATNGETITLYAQWNINSYKLTVNPNSGTWNGKTTNQEFTQNYGTEKIIEAPTKIGHTFNNWTLSGGGWIGRSFHTDGAFESGTNGVSKYNNTSGDTSVTVTRQAKSSDNPIGNYELKVITSGTGTPGYGGFVQPTGSAASQKYIHVFVAKLPEGYSFCPTMNATGDGRTVTWLTSRAGTGKFMVYAYKLEAGSTGTFGTFGYVYVEKVTGKAAPTFYIAYSDIINITSKEGTQKYIFGTANGVLTANWTVDTYTITLSNESATTAGTTAIYETYGSEYSLTSGGNAMTTSANPITVPTRTGYTFDGYYTQANGGTKYIDSTGKLTSSASNTQFSSNGTLYAHWTKTVNSLTNSISPTSYIYDGNAKSPTETVKDGNTSLTKNTDYTIVFTNNTNVGEATATITGKNAYNSTTKAYYIGETTIIYYINNAKITFNVAENSGTISGTNTLYTKKGVTEVYTDIRNTTQGVIPTATKAGYTFNGWYTAASGGTKVINADKSVVASVTNWTDANKKWQITEDKILYAQFTYTATPTITRDDFNTFSYTADGAAAYYVSTSSTKPNPGTAQSTFALNKWTTAVTTGNNITLADGQTYYVWAENTASTTGTVGNSANIIVRKVTRSQGTGSTLTTRIDGTSASTGTENTTTPYYVLNGTPVWSIATANTGYNTPVLKEGNTSRTATGYKIVVNSNITISSSATANNYTVEYYNGSTKLGSSDHVYGTSKNLTTIATLGGSDSTYNKFEGWATANNSVTIAHTDGKSVSNLTSTNSGTVKLYAVWSRTVNFYSGNSTTAVTKTQYKNTSTYSVEAPAPTAITGWTALGWRVNTTAADKSYGAGTASTITSNAGPNFYAVYSREATFYSGKNKATTKKATQYHNNGSNGTGTYSVSIPADNITSINTGGGWNIQGWRADTSASSKSYNTTGNITANAGPTFYAIYTRSLTMAYNANGGTGTTASHTSTQYYTSYNAVSSVTFKTAANGFSKDAYEFSKWANDSASGTQVVAGGNAAAFTPGVDSTATTKTMYAIWTPINYTITYELDSGSITGQKTSYNIETATFTIPNPKKIGFRFMGWTGSNNLSSGLESYTTSNPYICSSRDHALGNEFTVTPGTTYRIFVTARRTSGDLWMKGGIWYTQQSSGNSYDGYDGYFTHLKQINNIWDIYYKDVTVPAGKTKGKIYIMLEQNISGGSTSWIVADMYAINPSATVTVPQGSKGNKTYKANWEETFTSKEFSYTGNVQTFTVPETGTYKLEVWGAQGGSTYGGKGGYSYGNISLSAGSTLYVVVGGQGEYKDSTKATANGGYNGGGPGHCYGDEGDGGSGGGGATHIGTFNSTLAEHGNTTGLYIVAGGGGGFARWSNGQISNGGTGGGTSGGSSTIIGGGTTVEGGTQTTGNAFGQGGNGTGDNCGGGGGGLYGGKAKNLNGIGGAGGSGYIGGVTNGSTQNGIQEGNGKAKITIIE